MDHIHPDDFKAVRDFYSGFLMQNEEQHTEFRIIRPDGTMRWVR